MLVLARLRDESIMIGDEVEVKISDIRGDRVRLGITAPPHVKVYRKELYDQIKDENKQSAGLQPGDVRAAVPPVKGGHVMKLAGEREAAAHRVDWIEITPAALSADRALAFVSSPDAGGIDLFLGTTRSEKSAEGRQLAALDYQSYEAMAIDQLKKLAASARSQWPISKLAVLHRIGRVAVGQPSVVIAVSSPHRAEAFSACRWLIDQLKKDVTIWKQEIWGDGSSRWVQPE
jgi:molybdopterin synthase catalytic subunit